MKNSILLRITISRISWAPAVEFFSVSDISSSRCSDQLSAISYQLSAFSYQITTHDKTFKISDNNYQLKATDQLLDNKISVVMSLALS
jgi:hypothetical protein